MTPEEFELIFQVLVMLFVATYLIIKQVKLGENRCKHCISNLVWSLLFLFLLLLCILNNFFVL